MIAGLLAACLLPPAPARAAEPSLYEQGDAARRKGDLGAAKDLFSRLLSQDPASGGALEGLTLTCLSRREYEEALGYAGRWDERSPNSGYILGMKSRALRGLRRFEEALETDRAVVRADPCDVRTQRRLDEASALRRDGALGRFKAYKSISVEGLETGSPQRIIYEGRSGSLRGRARLARGLDLVAGAEVSQEAQRNSGRGFSYYDILEQTYWTGLEGRPSEDLSWRAEHGLALLSDIQGAGVGRTSFSRLRAGAEARAAGADWRLAASRAPKYLRGSGGRNYFALLRETSVRGEAETEALSWSWLARASLTDHSERTTYKAASLSASREFGSNLASASLSHGAQEYFGAEPDGRLRYTLTDRASARLRRQVEDRYRLSAAAGWTAFRDGERLADLDAEARGWLPGWRDRCGSSPLSAYWRASWLDYAVPVSGYRSNDSNAHWLGGSWRQGWGGSWTELGAEQGFLRDARGPYEGHNAYAELEWYPSPFWSLLAGGRFSRTTVREESWSLSLSARASFR